jgi:hypothetical protein
MQLQSSVHFGTRPKTFASSSVCSNFCLAPTPGALVLYITEKFRFPVIKTPDIARGTSHDVQVALRQGLHVTSRDYSL